MSSSPSQPAFDWPVFFMSWMKDVSDSLCYAPKNLQQTINPWTFAGLVVNENNSSSPATERAIVSNVSYGKQLGRIEDVLEALIKNEARNSDAFVEFDKMRNEIVGIKKKGRATRFQSVLDDLKQMKQDDRHAFDECMARIEKLRTD